METVNVFYTGKKKDLCLTMPWLSKKYHFRPDGVAVPMVVKDARRLIRENPVPFKTATTEGELAELLSDSGVDGDAGNGGSKQTAADRQAEIERLMSQEEVGESTKFPSQMNKNQLVEHAKHVYDRDLDATGKTKAELRKEIEHLKKIKNRGKG